MLKKSSVDSIDQDRDDHCNEVENYCNAQDETNSITKRKDNTDQGDNENYHDSHTDINESIERKNSEEKIKGQTPIIGVESPKSTEQYKNDYVSKIEIGKRKHLGSIEQNSCFNEVKSYYDVQD